MRTNEERIAAMHKKAGEMKRVRQLRRGLAVRGGALAVCLAAVIALALVLPGLAEGMTVSGHTAVMAASIISNNAVVGYIVVGIRCLSKQAEPNRRTPRPERSSITRR